MSRTVVLPESLEMALSDVGFEVFLDLLEFGFENVDVNIQLMRRNQVKDLSLGGFEFQMA